MVVPERVFILKFSLFIKRNQWEFPLLGANKHTQGVPYVEWLLFWKFSNFYPAGGSYGSK